MERDGLTAHGGSSMLRSILNVASDGTHVFVCEECNGISDTNSLTIRLCSHCGSSRMIKVESSHATQLLFNHLTTLGIKSSFQTK